MATVTVETYAELAAAIVSCADGDTIQIDNDINVDYEFPQGVEEIDLSLDTAKTFTVTGAHAPEWEVGKYYEKVGTSFRPVSFKPTDPAWEDDYASYYVKVDDAYIPVVPENYKIINLRNQTGITDWILSNGAIYFANVDFQNLILNGCHLLMLSGNGTDINVTQCRFTGSRSGASFLFNAAHNQNVVLVSCAFDIPWQGMGAAGTDAALAWTALAPKFTSSESSWTGSFTADFCRFHEHYTGWQIPSYQSSSPSNNQYVLSCTCFVMNGCYIYGDMTCSMTTQVTSNVVTLRMNAQICRSSVNAKNPQTAMNIVDVEFRGTASNTSTPEEKDFETSIYTGNLFGIIRNTCYCNSTGHPEYIRAQTTEMTTGFTTSGKAVPTYVDDVTFASDEALFRKGFDIIVREEE